MPKMPPSIKTVKELTHSQIRVLRTLALENGGRGVQKSDIISIARINGSVNEILGPIHDDDIHKWDEKYGKRSLRSYGFIEPVRDETDAGGDVILYRLTKDGRDVVQMVRTLPDVSDDIRIPAAILDPVVRAEMAKHKYGLDIYSDDDLTCIRDQLPEEYRHIPIRPHLMLQITGRRKQGAFKKTKTTWPDWYTAYRQTDHFKLLTSQVLKVWGYRCLLNRDHTTSPHVYHRHYSSLFEEGVEDCIVLCQRCFKANTIRLPLPPETDPTA